MTFGKLCDEIGMNDLERELAWAFVLVLRKLPERFWDEKKYPARAKGRLNHYPPRPLRRGFGRRS